MLTVKSSRLLNGVIIAAILDTAQVDGHPRGHVFTGNGKLETVLWFMKLDGRFDFGIGLGNNLGDAAEEADD